jgi:hypothetical protein
MKKEMTKEEIKALKAKKQKEFNDKKTILK